MKSRNLLTTGDGNPITTDITIIPGDTVEVIAEALKNQGIFDDTAEFLNICKTARASRTTTSSTRS